MPYLDQHDVSVALGCVQWFGLVVWHSCSATRLLQSERFVVLSWSVPTAPSAESASNDSVKRKSCPMVCQTSNARPEVALTEEGPDGQPTGTPMKLHIAY